MALAPERDGERAWSQNTQKDIATMSQASFTSLWDTWIPLPLFHIFPSWEYTCQSGHGPVTFLPNPVFTPVFSSVWPRNVAVFWIKLGEKALCCVRNQVYFVCFSHVYVFLCQAGMWGEKCLNSTLSAPDQNSLRDKLKRRVLKKLFSVMYRSPNPSSLYSFCNLHPFCFQCHNHRKDFQLLKRWRHCAALC